MESDTDSEKEIFMKNGKNWLRFLVVELTSEELLCGSCWNPEKHQAIKGRFLLGSM